MNTNNYNDPPVPFLYKTSDRGVAAALVALGHDVIDVDLMADPEILYAFPASPMLLSTVEAYWQDALPITAKRMAEAMQDLERLTGQQRDEKNGDLNNP